MPISNLSSTITKDIIALLSSETEFLGLYITQKKTFIYLPLLDTIQPFVLTYVALLKMGRTELHAGLELGLLLMNVKTTVLYY